MVLDRLLAGAALATVLAASASAQTTNGTSGYAPSTSTPSTTTQGYPSTPGTMSGGAMGGQSMPQGAAMAPGMAMAPSAAPYTPLVPSPANNIVAELKTSGQFATLLAALDLTNLTSVLQSTPNLTLIAPTDSAFAALPPGQLDALKKDPQKLQALLTYHLIAAKVTLAQVKGHAAGQVATAAKKPVTIDGSGDPIKINDASVLQAAVPASNGVIYVIDKVLTPPM